MARKAAKNVQNVPGERYRDERRTGGGARMHEREWHEHDEPHELERVANSEGFDAIPEVEASSDQFGMRRMQAQHRKSQGGERRKRSVPPSKGPKRGAKRI